MRLLRWRMTMLLAVGVISSPSMARAAAISLGARGDCNCQQMMGQMWCKCYFQGTVTFSNPDNVLASVQCWIAGVYSGQQNTGFDHTPGTGIWKYAQCCHLNPKIVGTGPYETTDAAYLEGGGVDPIASGQRNWSP